MPNCDGVGVVPFIVPRPIVDRGFANCVQLLRLGNGKLLELLNRLCALFHRRFVTGVGLVLKWELTTKLLWSLLVAVGGGGGLN